MFAGCRERPLYGVNLEDCFWSAADVYVGFGEGSSANSMSGTSLKESVAGELSTFRLKGTSCPSGALRKPGKWPAANSSGVHTS